ncbi:MAG: hypothetical protein ACE5MI_10920 [Acidimicrobiia bacterium]
MSERQTRTVRGALLVAVVVTLASCGGGASTPTESDEPEPAEPAVTEAPSPAGESPDQPEAPAEPAAPAEVETSSEAPAGPPVEECKEPATEIAIGSTVSETRDAEHSTWFFCVQIPEGVTSISVELTELTDDLALFVGFPDMEALRGGLGLRSSDVSGPEDELVLIEPPLFRGELGAFEQAEFVFPGSYYIEVSARSGRTTSPFTLRVTTT